MIRHQFPDLHWLKQLIQERKEAGLGWGTVILNVKNQPDFRPEVEGPFSLFMNLSGESRVATEGKWHRLRDNTFYLSRPGQLYTLALDEGKAGETFNIHFGERFFQQALHSLSYNHTRLLDNPEPFSQLHPLYPDRTFYRPYILDKLIHELKAQDGMPLGDEFEAILFSVFSLLYNSCFKEITAFQQLKVQKKATRQEIQRRLYLATEYIHHHYANKVSLDELASVACMSKFHFLRLFKEVFGMAPHHYLQEVRLERCQTLLTQTRLPLTEVADLVGMQYASSLSRLLRQRNAPAPAAQKK